MCETLELPRRQLEDRKIQIDRGRLEKALSGINHIHPAFKILAIRYICFEYHHPNGKLFIIKLLETLVGHGGL